MKKTMQIIKSIVLAGSILLLSNLGYSATTNDTILAVVNNDVITLKDLREYLSAIYMQFSAEGKSQDELRELMAHYEQNGIERLIEDKLLVDEAIKKEMTLRPEAIDEKIQKIRQNYSTGTEFLQALIKDGLTVTQLREKITDQLRAKYIIELEVKPKVIVSPVDVTKYYQDHINEFVSPESVDLDSIFIPYEDSSFQKADLDKKKEKEDARNKANEAVSLLKGRVDFSTVAKRFSKSPSIGVVGRGQMLPNVEAVIFNLKENEVSEPIQTETGVFVFRLKGRFPEKKSTLEEVRDTIYTALYNKKFQERMAAWLNELKKKAYIEIKG